EPSLPAPAASRCSRSGRSSSASSAKDCARATAQKASARSIDVTVRPITYSSVWGDGAGEMAERNEGEYAVHGGVSLKAHWYAPKGAGPFPAVVAIHGGGWRLSNLDNYRYLGPWLAERGYAVLAATHRLSTPAQKAYPEAVQDVRAAVQFVKAK